MRKVATTDAKLERIKKVHDITLQYPRVKALLSELDRCRIYTPVQAEPRCMLLVGESGVGKSQLIDWYVSQHPNQTGPEAERRPIVYVRVPEGGTCKQLAMQLLDELGAPYRQSAQLGSLTRQIARLTHELGIEQLIVDEVQHLVRHIDSHKTLVASDWFKTIINESRISLVLVGNLDARTIIVCNPQLARRIRSRHTLEPFSWVRGEKEFRSFVSRITKELSQLDRLPWDDRGLFSRLYLSTHGNVGALMALLREAVVRCIEDDTPHVTMAMLRELAKAMLDQTRLNACDAWELSESDVEERICRVEALRPKSPDYQPLSTPETTHATGPTAATA